MADRLLVSGGAPPKGFMKTHGATDTTDMLEAEAIKADFHAAVSEAATCELDQRTGLSLLLLENDNDGSSDAFGGLAAAQTCATRPNAKSRDRPFIRTGGVWADGSMSNQTIPLSNCQRGNFSLLWFSLWSSPHTDTIPRPHAHFLVTNLARPSTNGLC
jgi:hypothetical protein